MSDFRFVRFGPRFTSTCAAFLAVLVVASQAVGATTSTTRLAPRATAIRAESSPADDARLITKLDGGFEAIDSLFDERRAGEPFAVHEIEIMDAWREGGLPVSRETVASAKGSLTPNVDASIVVDAAWLSTNSARGGVALLDARAPEFYLGYSAGQMPRAGHIPNARNVPFSSLTSELTQLRDQPKLSRLFAAAGVAKGDTVVTYCHIGMQASLLYYAARRLGHDARIYDGSYEDWSKRSDLPVVNESMGKKP